MGIFKRNKEKKENVRKIEIPQILENEFDSILELGSSIIIYNIEKETPVQHRNSEKTNLMTAKALKIGQEGFMNFDASDSIAFEVRESQELNKVLLEAIANEYEKQNSLNNEVCNYLGMVDSIGNGYGVTRKSKVVENYVKENIVPRILEEREQKRLRIEENNRQRQAREDFRASLNAKNYVAEMEEIKQERLENLYLEKINVSEIDGRKYEDYDGINTKTGEILRIRRLDKVGKDGEGMYLYQGYVYSTMNKDDVEILGKGRPMGAPVCFELPARMSDIEASRDSEYMKKVLDLISRDDNEIDYKHLTYIGGIDKEGNVTRDGVSNSKAIRATVEKLKENFGRENEEQEK